MCYRLNIGKEAKEVSSRLDKAWLRLFQVELELKNVIDYWCYYIRK